MDYVVIAMACGIVLLLLLFRTKARFVLNFLVRAVLGVMLILFANNFLQKRGKKN
jgi:inhibitor of the pro-sigma K processing machinery